MADVTLTYKGATIAEMDASGSKTLKTAGKYCEDDIGVSYVKPSGGGSGVDIPDSAFVLSGYCQYWDYGGQWDSFITAYSDKWSTLNIETTASMFNSAKLQSVPFQINLKQSAQIDMNAMFLNSGILTLPVINGNGTTISQMHNFLRGSKIKNVPDNYFACFTTISDYCNMYGVFQDCKMLRNFPTSFSTVAALYNRASQSGAPYSYMCSSCFVLDEITNLGVSTLSIFTRNAFSSCVDNCSRLKNFTFEGGKTANWKSQTIDLSVNVGYGLYVVDAQSAGITAQKQVFDDETYQSLKNNVDWYTFKAEYSRYNHDSAVATINSLPDTSAYLATAGGTNTIKFKGAAGSATDGGAINTLTEEEIAVATAKGWTCSLV